jgi:homoserine O-succinyltransferase
MPTTSLAQETVRAHSFRRQMRTRNSRPLRVGVLGLSAESPASLIEPLSRAALPVHAISIHLGTTETGPVNTTSGEGVSFTRAILDEPLDGLVLTGASNDPDADPAALPQFRELTEIIEYARGFVPSTLGLGMGGLLLAHVLGLRLERLDDALHGLVPQRVLHRDHPLFGRGSEVFFVGERRSLRVSDESLGDAVAEGRINPLAGSPQGGLSIFESADGRCVGHLGHPEQRPSRGSDQSRLSAFYDSARESARAHAAAFFEAWVTRVYELGQRGRAVSTR